MKKYFAIVTLVVAFAVSALGGGGEWNFVDRPPVDMVDGQVVRNPEISFVGDFGHQRALASVNSAPALPARLPMGSPRILREYILGTNSMSMNVYVGLQAEDPTIVLLMTGKATRGYSSYEEFLGDIREGMAVVLKNFRTNQIPSTAKVYSIVHVTYFNDHKPLDGRGNGLALSMLNECSTFDSMDIEKIMSVVGLESPANEQLILSVPKMSRIDMAVNIGTVTATMTWTPSSGAKTSSLWSNYSKREWTTDSYLYIRGWMAVGAYPARISLETASGNATYTEFGDNLEDTKLQMTANGIVVKSPRGGIVDVQGSSDLINWTMVTTVTVGADGAEISLGTPRPQYMFFRGESRKD